MSTDSRLIVHYMDCCYTSCPPSFNLLTCLSTNLYMGMSTGHSSFRSYIDRLSFIISDQLEVSYLNTVSSKHSTVMLDSSCSEQTGCLEVNYWCNFQQHFAIRKKQFAMEYFNSITIAFKVLN